MKRVTYTGKGGLHHNTREENERIQQHLIERNKRYQRQFIHSKQAQHRSPRYIDKKRHHHKIEIVIAILTLMATVAGAVVTWIGSQENHQRMEDRTEKFYQQTPKPKVVHRTRIKKIIVKKPKTDDAVKKEEDKLKQEVSDAKDKAEQAEDDRDSSSDNSSNNDSNGASNAVTRLYNRAKNTVHDYAPRMNSNQSNSPANNANSANQANVSRN